MVNPLSGCKKKNQKTCVFSSCPPLRIVSPLQCKGFFSYPAPQVGLLLRDCFLFSPLHRRGFFPRKSSIENTCPPCPAKFLRDEVGSITEGSKGLRRRFIYLQCHSALDAESGYLAPSSGRGLFFLFVRLVQRVRKVRLNNFNLYLAPRIEHQPSSIEYPVRSSWFAA